MLASTASRVGIFVGCCDNDVIAAAVDDGSSLDRGKSSSGAVLLVEVFSSTAFFSMDFDDPRAQSLPASEEEEGAVSLDEEQAVSFAASISAVEPPLASLRSLDDGDSTPPPLVDAAAIFDAIDRQ